MWISRNKNGFLQICNSKPIRQLDKIRNFGWWEDSDNMGILEISDKNLFPNLTWEDEPIEVEIISIKELLQTQKELRDTYKKLFTANQNIIKLQEEL